MTASFWPLDPSDLVAESTVASLLRETAAGHPHALAVIEPADEGSRRWTYRRLEAGAEARAHRLLELFEPGERIALWAPTSADWLLTEYAAALAGLVLVTVNPALQAAELRHVLATAGVAGIVLVDEHRGHPLRSVLDEVRPGLPSLREILPLRGPEWSPTRGPGQLPEPGPDDVAQIHFTSGTTGPPKGAMLHHRGITNNMRFHADVLGMTSDDVLISPVPMFHVGGAVMANLTALNAGATLVPVRTWDAGTVLELIEAERATALIGVPTMFLDLLARQALERRDVSSMRLVMVGGSAVPTSLIHRLEDVFGASVRNSFGQTECGSIISATRHDDAAVDVAETLGRPFPGIAAKIVGPDGRVQPRGVAGELLVRGYQVMTGYYGAPELTADAFDDEGWLRTGDVCTMDDRGYLRFVSRLKEMIIRGGENLFPAEIEDVLRAHDDVSDVAVVGVPDERLGESVAAFVRLVPGRDPDAGALRAHAAARLAREKVPAHWRFVAEFPTTPAGKIRKSDLRTDFLSTTTHELESHA